jgi:HK97 gp10 family phage protein
MAMLMDTSGFKEILDALGEWSGPTLAEAARAAVRAGAAVIQAAMVEDAPVLEEQTAKSSALSPGALRSDIEVLPVHADKDGEYSTLIGPGKSTQHVAEWVEYGHRLVKGGQSKVGPDGRTSGIGHEVGRVKPHPFLRPAYERSAADALAAAENAAREVMKKRIG